MGEHSILFSTDGDGRWSKREWKPQCSHDGILLSRERCQGTEGHMGHHWCYAPDGSYEYESNDADPSTIDDLDAGGNIPPDHASYVSPITMARQFHMNFFVDTEVTDPEEIARLERGEIRDGESITRPI